MQFVVRHAMLGEIRENYAFRVWVGACMHDAMFADKEAWEVAKLSCVTVISEKQEPRTVRVQAASFVAMAERMGGRAPWVPSLGDQDEGGKFYHVVFVHR